jgi:hypothetical protein
LLQLWLCCAGYSLAGPKLEQILPQVQQHVKEFEFSLPDFICDETIISRELVGGAIHHETVIVSAFRGIQHRDEEGRPFTESREIKSVDGHPPIQGQPLKGPFFFGGGFSSLLDEIFSQKNEPYFNYRLAGAETIDGKIALVINFETKEGQREILYREIFGSQAVVNGKGKAWIDPRSMNVVRLEFQYLNPPFQEGILEVSVDYDPVVINRKSFWMPKTVTAEQTVPNPRHSVGGQYIASYSNYQQFNVSVKFKY